MNNGEQFFNTSGGGYAIERSLRFNSSDSAYLSRTPASAGNRKTWTWAGWVKRGDLANRGAFFAACNSGATSYTLGEFDAERIRVLDSGVIAGSDLGARTTTAVFRDPSAWYHIVLVYDTTNATDADRIRIYVNGSRITSFSEERSVTQNLDSQVNLNTQLHSISRYGAYAARYHDGYLADIHFIDGQALDPTSFGEFDEDTGIWNPIAYSGSYGTNGFHLDFSDNSTAAALGTDSSGNGNTWTVNNISVAAGAGNDSLVDVPTNGTETDTGVGGEVRGNYCTWNTADPNTNSAYVANGNLQTTSASINDAHSSFRLSTGKWYWEISVDSVSGGWIGVSPSPWSGSTLVAYRSDGTRYLSGSWASYGSTYTSGDVIGIAYDVDAGTVRFYKNNVAQPQISYAPGVVAGPVVNQIAANANFGQRPFAYTAPSGFKALCTANLPTPTIADGSTAMDVVTYTGNGSTQTISGLGFSPDFVWLKKRNGATSHRLFDVVRGATKNLYSNTTDAEGTDSTTLSSFDSTGFSLGDNGAVNNLNDTYVAWTWDAGSSTVTNTDGSITSSVRANATAGFSVVTYTGTGANATVGHGLGVAPSLIIAKARNKVDRWNVFSATVGADKYLNLGNTDSALSSANVWNNTSPTSTVFSLGTDSAINGLYDYVAYCFAPVEGYSAFGSYTGNGNADGPFVYTNGMRPRFIMVKRTDAGSEPWVIHDAARDSYNGYSVELYPNNSNAEGGPYSPPIFDFLSNGFKIRSGGATAVNGSGGTFIYCAFAEHPFKYARAR